MNKLKFWFQNARPISLPQSMLPALTAVALSIGGAEFSIVAAIASLFGVLFLHLGNKAQHNCRRAQIRVRIKDLRSNVAMEAVEIDVCE